MNDTLKAIQLYNTATRRVEALETLEPGRVKLYCCGPTVYNFQHIGNLRTYIFEDLLARTLRYAGYNVQHVMNITDVGHLVSDADEGEDKMLLAAKREGKRSEEIAQYYTDIFFDHCQLLNIIRPNVVCKATEHVTQMIDLIKRLEERGFAYTSGGNVYFDVGKFERYDEFARLNLEKMQAGARIEVDQQKRGPYDFALWFTKSKFDNQELQWDSPWGTGYPGWHIECSAMAMEHLGETIDIHCGGIDHIPVHHTNEIAQSECGTGKTFAKTWMHGGFLVTGKDKMSKSSGGFLTLDKIVEKGLSPISYRLFCLSGSYRQELSWSWEAIEASENTLRRLRNQVFSWRKEAASDTATDTPLDTDLLSEFETAVFNDLGMSQALAVLHKTSASKDIDAAQKLALFSKFDQILGLGIDTWEEAKIEIPDEVLALSKQREQARSDKNWAEADALREKIDSLGFDIEDAADGTKLNKKR